MYINEKGILYYSDDNPVTFKKAAIKNYSAQVNKKETVILHYTGSILTSSSIAEFMNPTYRISAHFLIERNGNIIQFVSTDYIAYHAGNWNVNVKSIGIELDNVGYSRFGFYVPECDTISLTAKGQKTVRAWERFRPDQINSLIELLKAIKHVYPIKSIIGHSDVPGTQSIDPGPAFPWSDIEKEVSLT